MLSEKVFNYGIDLLEQNHDRKLPPAIKLIWREYLDENLADSEFVSAVKHSILHSRFMPTASDLVEHIHGGREAKAIQEWQSILQASGKVEGEELLAYLSIRGKVALQAIGGLHKVGLAEEYQRQRMEKNFVTVYCQCSSKDSKVLPQSSSIDSVQAKNEDEQPCPMPEHVRQQLEQLGAKFAMNKGGGKS